jgi:hypothetical protein
LATCDEAVENEQDYCADHSTNETHRFSCPVPPDRLTQIGRNERAYNSQNGRQNKSLRLIVVARHNEFGNQSNDKANDNCPKDAHRIAPGPEQALGMMNILTRLYLSSLDIDQ